MQEKAYAKINLTLDILGTREDGFHEVAMIMQSIALRDDLYIEKTDGGIELTVEGADLPTDENNLCYKAARLMVDEFKIAEGVKIRLVKKIPSEAGLGGGSSDAAAVLRGMNKLFSLNLTNDEMEKLGAKIGSDVPFCIAGRTQFATGRGEILTKLPSFPHYLLVLAKPNFSISTPWAYKTYDSMTEINRPNNDAAIKAIKTGDKAKMFSYMGNVLEVVARTKYPQIEEYKSVMKNAGAIFTQMTGSGSVVFGVAKDEKTAENIAEAINKTGCKVFITETMENIGI